MAFNLDIIEQIGQWCDDRTHLKLCLVDKAYFETQRSYLEGRYTVSVVMKTKKFITEFEQAPAGMTRLKLVHQLYRFLLNEHPKFLKRHEKLRVVMLNKLEEYRSGNGHGLRMGRAPYRKYRKALLAL
jgi:hypothetical protein